ncbi:MAG: hypothetical protein HDS78_07505 [Bacteroidales bacterium]|nr:hypothetical protein [Bacteroidales bacterium]
MPRDPRHDYRTRCIYHITMTKAAGVPAFSKLVGPPEAVEVERLPVGRIIERHLRTTRALCPHLRVLQYVIMPDHIHFAIFAEDYLPRALGSYIGMLKVNRANPLGSLRSLKSLKTLKTLKSLYTPTKKTAGASHDDPAASKP